MISIVLPVHNKADMIERVLRGIYANSSSLVEEIIIVLDGCTDESDHVVRNFINWNSAKVRYQLLFTPDVWEIKACNVGLKAATQPFVVSIQDDMVLTELGWDVRLIKPFLVWEDVFAVTALSAVNLNIIDTKHITWCEAVNDHNSPRNKFIIRDVVNRGPLMFRKQMLAQLGYLDEIYAPICLDDMDICLQAWKKYGWVSGLYPMPAFFDPKDGTSRQNANSAKVYGESWEKNMPILISRHHDVINGPKHSEERLLEA